MSYEYYNLMADLINEQNTSQDFDEWSVFIIRQLSETITLGSNSDDVLKLY